MRIGLILLEKPALHRREGNRTSHNSLLRANARNSARRRGEFSYCLILKELLRCQTQPSLPCFSDDSNTQNRVAAKTEEVFIDANSIETQRLSPYISEQLL